MPLTITKNYIIGTWKLLSFQITTPTGEVSNWGKAPTGTLIYTAENSMSVGFNSGMSATDDYKERFDGILFYSGTYKIEGNTIVHHVENASDVNRIGQTLVREANLQDEVLQLVGRGDFGTAVVRWKKI